MIEKNSICCEVFGDKVFDFKLDAFATLEIVLDNQCNGTEIMVTLAEKFERGDIAPSVSPNVTFLRKTIKIQSGLNHILFPIAEHIAPDVTLPKCQRPVDAKSEVLPFRYVKIENFTGEVTLIRKSYFCDWNDSASCFESNSVTLNRIWEFCKYSMKATSCFGKYVDGQRERLIYEGDVYINQLGHFCCDTNFTLARNSIEHLFSKPTWPTEWHLLMPIICRDFMLYSGENHPQWQSILEKKLLSYALNSDGLIQPPIVEGHFDVTKCIRDIVDWPQSERDNYEFDSVNFVPNCYLYGALLAMYEIYKESKYLNQAKILRATLRKKMLKNGLFVDNENSNHTSLHSAMFAVRFGIADKTEFQKIRPLFKSKGMACSVYGAQFLLESCYSLGMADYALELMVSSSNRSWNNMLLAGATISMEAWDDSFKPNQDWNHAWGAAPANIIPRFFCGIRPISNGFKKFVIAPQNVDVEFYLKHPTIHGDIIFDGKQITIPANTQGVYKNKILDAGTHLLDF